MVFLFFFFPSLTITFFPADSPHISCHLVPGHFCLHLLHILHRRCSSLAQEPPPAQVRRAFLPDDLRGNDGPHRVPAGGSGMCPSNLCWSPRLASPSSPPCPGNCQVSTGSYLEMGEQQRSKRELGMLQTGMTKGHPDIPGHLRGKGQC